MTSDFVGIVPVLPSANIQRDLDWYRSRLGFQVVFADSMYAAIRRGSAWLHLQWHADTPQDPLNGGSVVRLFVRDIQPWYEDLRKRGAVEPDRLHMNTPWQTHEFGVQDLNGNALFFVQDTEASSGEAP